MTYFKNFFVLLKKILLIFSERNVFQKNMVRPGCIIVDVGLNRVTDATGDNKVVGDANKNVREVR